MKVSIDGQCLSSEHADPSARQFVWQSIVSFTRGSAGVEVEVLTFDPRAAEALRGARVRVRRLDLPESADRPDLQTYAQRVNQAFRLAWVDQEPDVILLPDIVPPDIAFIEPFAGIPIVALLHAPPRDAPDGLAHRTFLSRLRALRDADAWFLVSSLALREKLAREQLLDANRAETLPPPVDLSRYRPSENGQSESGPPTALTLAREETLDSMRLVFRACAGLAGNLSNARLIVAIDEEDSHMARAVQWAAAQEGMADARWRFVPDDDPTMAEWLSRADVFIHAAIDDYIGLPLLQALAAGCPAICVESGALPEIAGTAAMTGSTRDPEELRERLARLLRHPRDNEAWARKGPARAAKYDPRHCARRLVQTAHQEHKARQSITGDLRVAFVAPLPQDSAGLGQYSTHLARELRDHLDLDVYTARQEGMDPILKTRFHVFPIQDLEQRMSKYDIALYQMGARREEFAPYFEQLSRHPGAVILHDLNLHGFFHAASEQRGPIESNPYFQEMRYCYGEAGAEEARAILEQGRRPDWRKLFLNDRITRRSRAVIVHSRWAAQKILENGDPIPTLTMPRGAHPNPQFDQTAMSLARDRMRQHGEFMIIAAGRLDFSRRIETLLRAMRELKQRNLRPVLGLLGEQTPDVRAYVDQQSRALDLTREIIPFGFIEPYDEFLGHLAAADVVFDLRWPPTRGVSGFALSAMAMGKPTMISDSPENVELPNDAALKVAIDDFELPTTVEILAALARSSSLREMIGREALKYVKREAAWPQTARRLAGFLYQLTRRYEYAPTAE